MSAPKKCDCAEYIGAKHFHQSCPLCNKDDYLEWGHFCGCGHQYGHIGFMRCKHCKKGIMPMTGEGYCDTVKIVRHTVKQNSRCIKIGCQKVCRTGKDYCCYTHAKEDGATK